MVKWQLLEEKGFHIPKQEITGAFSVRGGQRVVSPSQLERYQYIFWPGNF